MLRRDLTVLKNGSEGTAYAYGATREELAANEAVLRRKLQEDGFLVLNEPQEA